MTVIGYAGGNNLQVILKDISGIEHLAVVVTTVLLLVRYFRGRRKPLR